MSSYMAIALNLFGRPQDELSHVLILPKEREEDRNFFYPVTGDKQTRIDYAQIPFIRLREKLTKIFGDIRQLDYSSLIKLTKLDLEDISRDIKARLDKGTRKLLISWGAQIYRIGFEPKLFAIYQFLFEHNDPQELAENINLQNLYSNNYGSGKEGKFDLDNIKKDVSAINHKLLEPQLPEFLYELLKIKTDKDSSKDMYFISINFKSRNV